MISAAFFLFDPSFPFGVIFFFCFFHNLARRLTGHAPMKQARAHGTSLVSVAATSIAGAGTYVAGLPPLPLL